METLTNREQQIADLISKGFSDSYIAIKFKIEKSTLATHKSNIYQKLLLDTDDNFNKRVLLAFRYQETAKNENLSLDKV